MFYVSVGVQDDGRKQEATTALVVGDGENEVIVAPKLGRGKAAWEEVAWAAETVSSPERLGGRSRSPGLTNKNSCRRSARWAPSPALSLLFAGAQAV